MGYKRNVDKHTDAATARANIIRACVAAKCTSSQRVMRKAQLGRVAFPDYNFSRAQGAAFSVAKIVSDMEREGLMRWHSDEWTMGYYLTQKGVAAAPRGDF